MATSIINKREAIMNDMGNNVSYQKVLNSKEVKEGDVIFSDGYYLVYFVSDVLVSAINIFTLEDKDFPCSMINIAHVKKGDFQHKGLSIIDIEAYIQIELKYGINKMANAYEIAKEELN